MELINVKTYDLIAELRTREDVYCIVNDRTSKSCVAFVEGGDLHVDKGECIILIVPGLYDA